MIVSQEKFFTAVLKMRKYQKEYFRTKYPEVLYAAKKCEAEVDAIIKAKCAENARKLQPELRGV